MTVLHFYAPRIEVAHAVNDRFFGRYSIDDLPSYYRVTPEGVAFADRLIDRVIFDSNVELVIGDPEDYDAGRYPDPDGTKPWLEGYYTGLLGIIGPQGLEVELGDTAIPKQMLWDKGEIDALHTSVAGVGIVKV